MTLLLHIIIALASVIYTTYLYLAPSKSKLRVSYALVSLTLASGTYLIWSLNAPLWHACLSGFIYTTFVTFGIVAARHQLATANATK